MGFLPCFSYPRRHEPSSYTWLKTQPSLSALLGCSLLICLAWQEEGVAEAGQTLLKATWWAASVSHFPEFVLFRVYPLGASISYSTLSIPEEPNPCKACGWSCPSCEMSSSSSFSFFLFFLLFGPWQN